MSSNSSNQHHNLSAFQSLINTNPALNIRAMQPVNYIQQIRSPNLRSNYPNYEQCPDIGNQPNIIPYSNNFISNYNPPL